MAMRTSIQTRFNMSASLKLSLAAVAIALCSVTHAQQDPMYTMYMWNTLSVNPGYAGSADLFTVTGLAREQWVGLDGAPSTQTLTLHTPLNNNALGVGLSAVHDEVGPVNNTLLFGDFAYRIRVTQNARLAFGLKAGVDLFQADLTSVPGTDIGDPLFQQNVGSSAKPNFGFGLYYWSNRGYLGISAPKLMQHSLLGVNDGNGNVNVITQKRHYFLIGGYVFKLNRELKLKPSTLIRYQIASGVQADLNANLIIKDRIWTGISYRTMDALVGSFEVVPTSQWRLGYAYDLGLSDLTPYHRGTHELTVQYEFGKRLQVRDPRYF